MRNKFVLCFTVWLTAVGSAVSIRAAEPEGGNAREPVFKVSSIQIDGARSLGVDQILQQAIAVDPAGDRLTAAEAGQGQSMRLSDFDGKSMRTADASVLRAIASAVLKAYADRKIAAVRVTIPQASLSRVTGDQADGVLVIAVQEGQAAAVRSRMRGEDGKVSDGAGGYDRFAVGSPVQSSQPIQLEEINRYVTWLNRHPGRRVDATLNSMDADGRLALDYIVTEDHPFSVYYNASNTGTAQTSRWRQRFGLLHTNLTGHDDILSLDYITSDFDSVHAVTGGYEAPIPGLERLRLKGTASWSTYVASDVGLANLQLKGESYSFGGEAVWNFLQRETLFVDLVAGAHWDSQKVDNSGSGTKARTEFLIPYIGLRGDRRGQTSNTYFSVELQSNFPELADTEADQLPLLGRSETDRDWQLIQFSTGHGFFIEPLLNDQWGRPGGESTMAHEISASLRGQRVFDDDRVPPSYTQTIGGFFSVRGYPESFAAADNSIIGSAEYRLHIPRLFSPSEPGRLFGQSFRFKPEQELGRVDWDLIFRAFIDAGYVWHNDRQKDFENDVAMVGAGVGAELTILRHFTARIDWGMALHTADNGNNEIDAGNQRVHVSFTVSY